MSTELKNQFTAQAVSNINKMFIILWDLLREIIEYMWIFSGFVAMDEAYIQYNVSKSISYTD